MFSCIMRAILFLLVCLAIVQAYPPSMSRTKWIPVRVGRPHLIHDGNTNDYPNLTNENENDLNDSNGFATWLFRSRKFCCAPPL